MVMSTLAWASPARANLHAPHPRSAPQVGRGHEKAASSKASAFTAALAATSVATMVRPQKGLAGTSRRAFGAARRATATAVETKEETQTAAARALQKSLEKENLELLEKFSVQVERINGMEEKIEVLDNDALRAKTAELREKIKAAGKVTEAVLEEAFAVLREAVWRVLELWYFDVQLLGGLVLHAERLAEMKTGEGKTIVALLPTFIAALEDKGGVFVVTPNDYLARRDAENVGQVLEFLGVSVGLIQSTMETEERQKQYENAVVYATNAELGFDYLRDNLAVYPSQVVQRTNFHFCLVDEADSILIDEARTPLIISESVPAVPTQFEAAREVAMALTKDLHYQVEEKGLNVVLTDLGEKVAGELLGVENMWAPEQAWILYVLNALKAKELMKVNEQYIIRDGKIAIVDTFTGRVLEGRRWSDGMHQAIECKEGISVSVRSEVTASITYQSLFRLFPRLCGMTGTAMTEAGEFEEIYGLRATAVPTALPMVRRDYADVVYKTEEAKINSIVNEITRMKAQNQRPILIGTSSVNLSEVIVSRLKENGIEPLLLNARPESVARESETIAQAGRLGKVTVATNMAGRGTDIILGGNPTQMATLQFRRLLCEVLPLPLEDQARVPPIPAEFFPIPMPAELQAQLTSAIAALAKSERGQNAQSFLGAEELVAQIGGGAPFEEPSQNEMLACREAFGTLKVLYKEALADEREAVLKAGGLYVLGTCRHESRRIDNQLRGRAGRQGDPGTSRFFLSLQDEVFRVFGAARVEGIMDRFRLGDEIPLESNIVTDTLDRVQQAAEDFFKKSRTTLFEFDKVISRQRELIYRTRKDYLAADQATIKERLAEWGVESVDFHLEQVKDMEPEARAKEFEEYYGFPLPVPVGNEESHLEEIKTGLLEEISKKWNSYEDFRPGFAQEAAQIATVVTIDDEWKLLLQKMDALKQTVGLSMYKGSNPLKEYQVQGFRMYEKIEPKFKARSVSRWLRSKPKKE